jgi:predicted dienelactone hydrolase
MKALAILAVAACSGSSATSFTVDVMTRTFVDTTRPTPANGTAPASSQRRLVTDIWHPTSGGPFPLIVFVHGSTTSRKQSTFLTQALAEAGYVVVAADFPLTAGSTPGGSSDLHVEDERGDVAFLADRAAAFAADETDPLHGAIDPAAGYAVVGHSTGGTVALLSAFGDAHDDRVRAAVTISGDSCFFAPAFFTRRAVPLLSLTGSRDLFVPPPDNARRTYDLAGPPKMFASLVGGNHMFFTDFEIDDAQIALPPTTATSDLAVTLAKYGDGAACSPIPAPSTDPPMAFADEHDWAARIITDYLDHVLRGKDLPALDDPAVVVERAF